MDLGDVKKAARKAASEARKAAASKAAPDAASQLASILVKSVPLDGVRVVSGFLPIGSEVDVLPLLDRLAGNGIDICLPVVLEKNRPLVFRRWRDGDALVEESFGTRAPGPGAPEVAPDLLIVPMLAFDRDGFRLGYGGGFYDRTLAKLRSKKRVTAVGVAFAGQEVANVPHDGLDQPLDWIVTEREAIRIS